MAASDPIEIERERNNNNEKPKTMGNNLSRGATHFSGAKYPNYYKKVACFLLFLCSLFTIYFHVRKLSSFVLHGVSMSVCFGCVCECVFFVSVVDLFEFV